MLEVNRSVTYVPLRYRSAREGSPTRSSTEYGKPLACNTMPSSTWPQAPMMPSQGLVSTLGSGSTGRAPSFNSRVKQSCRLSKRRLRASLRSRSENSFQMAMELSRTIGLRTLLKRPTNKVSQRRGTRLVSRKLRFSCPGSWEINARTVIYLSLNCNSVRAVARGGTLELNSGSLHSGRGDSGVSAAESTGPAAALARQASLARRSFEVVAAPGPLCPVLRVQRGRVLQRRLRAGGSCRTTPCRLHAAGGVVQPAVCEDRGCDSRYRERRV